MAEIWKGYRMTLPYTTGLPYDVTENIFHVRVPDDDDWDEAATHTALFDFYNAVPTGETQRLANYIGLQVSRAALAMKLHQWDIPLVAGPLGPPTLVGSGTLAAHGAATEIFNFPDEVALCGSYRGDIEGVPEKVGTTRPRARRRGRLYIGPLTTAGSAAGDDSTDSPRPWVGLQNILLHAMIDLSADLGAASAEWCVFSRADWEMYAIVNRHVDNAYDTQRRRGVSPTSRVSG